MSSPRYRVLAVVLGILTLLASLTSLAGCDPSGSTTSAATATASPGLDAQSQAYLAVLESYYQPLASDYLVVWGCYLRVGSRPDRAQQCQPSETTVVGDMKALAAHLTVPPPARWQTQDTQLKQAGEAAVPAWETFAAAQSASDWDQRKVPADEAIHLYCPPILQVNRDIFAAGLPLSSQLTTARNCST